MLMSVGFGMIAGLACWVIGIWGKPASLAEAALPPPYSAEFFADRLKQWIDVACSRRDRRAVHRDRDRQHDPAGSRHPRTPARNEDQVSIWWLAGLRRRRHGADRRRDPLLPVHERVGGPHGAGGPRRVRHDPLVRRIGERSKIAAGRRRGAHRRGPPIACVLRDTLSERLPCGIFALMVVIGVLVIIRAPRPVGACPHRWPPGLAALLVFGSLGWLLYDGVDRTGGSARRTSGPSRACARRSRRRVQVVDGQPGDAPDRAARELR